MDGPHFRHLTHSYVVALGLAPFWYEHPQRFEVVVNGRRLTFSGHDLAVVYNHALYLRAPDGLSWDWKE